MDTLTKDAKAQGYWVERLIAFVIDAIILWVVITIISVLAFLPMLFAGPLSFSTFGGFLAGFGTLTALSGVIFVLYFTLGDFSYGRTVGKALFRLNVTTGTGTRPTLGQSFIRNISKIYWLLLLLDVIVGLALETDYRKKFSDRYAGTIVVKS